MSWHSEARKARSDTTRASDDVAEIPAEDVVVAELTSIPRLGHGLRWSDVVADIERDQAERERRAWGEAA